MNPKPKPPSLQWTARPASHCDIAWAGALATYAHHPAQARGWCRHSSREWHVLSSDGTMKVLPHPEFST